ncbi:MAG: branched-chain amino acid ABC transporter permease [Paracoccaceae bacterium]|nr:branched-chain amino acid ABC transporter permease [Paracoccaceae bacterium]
MLYREVGEYKTSYAEDSQTFPIKFDRYRYFFVLLVGILFVPFVINDYWAGAVFLPFLIYAIASLGLNILTGYCGQVSLGTGGFMAVGAYAAYKLMTAFPDLNIFFVVIISGFVTAAVGTMFGLPSLRIKGFYLAVATLAAQFFLVWLFNKVGWFYNYSASGQITAPARSLGDFLITGPDATPAAQYLFCFLFVFILAWIARNLTRGKIGRSWMAIRDMDIAAEIIGVNPLIAKLSAFAISSFYVGVAGALFFTVYLGAVEVTEAFNIQKSFIVLFMIIIGGLGSIFGSFAGAAFMVLMPVVLKNLLVTQLGWATDIAAHFEFIIIGGLIVFFLIVEPHGLAQLWNLLKQKLRLWPFPY